MVWVVLLLVVVVVVGGDRVTRGVSEFVGVGQCWRGRVDWERRIMLECFEKKEWVMVD